MKKTLLITVFYGMLCAYSTAQNETTAKDFDIPVKNKKILLLGEVHETCEIGDMERSIIGDVIDKNKQIRHFQLCWEMSFGLQYHIENLLEYGDTLTLKRYLQCRGTRKRDSLPATKRALYNDILYYAQMAKSMQSGSLQIRCIDVEYSLFSTVFTILHILRKYEIRDSLF
ncbi:MAG: hypothetical protein LBL18_04495, partial [Bacteroidales bacterium]|nr:hypothetical protein [Bacteroidales bacterium]